MITITIDDRKFDMPNSWEEVTFEQYIKIAKVDELNDLYKISQYVSILSGIEYEMVLQLTLEEFNKINLDWMLKQIPQKNEWEINGTVYKVNDNLNSLTVAEFADLQNFSKKIDDYDKLLAVLLRPVGEKYNSATVGERAKLFREKLNGADIYTITNFFFAGGKGLSKNLMTSSQEEKKETAGE